MVKITLPMPLPSREGRVRNALPSREGKSWLGFFSSLSPGGRG